MTLFEKIYWTCLIVNIVLFVIGELDDTECLDITVDITWLKDFLFLQIFLTICYLLIKAILFIWGIHIGLFPTLWEAI